MKGVLSPGRATFLNNRYPSIHNRNTSFINMPNFQADRGRRKISKMGGITTAFSQDNSSQSSSTQVPSSLQMNEPIRRKDKEVRRLTNAIPPNT